MKQIAILALLGLYGQIDVNAVQLSQSNLEILTKDHAAKHDHTAKKPCSGPKCAAKDAAAAKAAKQVEDPDTGECPCEKSPEE
jgi:hypothetical protein